VTTRLPRFPLALVAVALSVPVSSCMLGPKYERPQMPAPPEHRFQVGPTTEASLADLPWWEVMRDPVLQRLLEEAIAGNLDLVTATARVEETRAQHGIAKSFLFPEVNVTGGYGAEQVSRLSEPPQGTRRSKHNQNYNLAFPVSWEIDLFGRIRREKEAAFAQYLASEHGRRAVLVTLVGDVAATYFFLRELDEQVLVSRRTVDVNNETVRFYETRLEGGVSNRLEMDRAMANRARTAAVIPALEQQVAITENALCLLLGRLPGPIERGDALTDESGAPIQIPAGLPASLLERRPDVQAAEQELVAANANIGAAKALFFPTISLTGAFGTLSAEFSNLFRANANVWQVQPGLFTPIFQGGRIRNNYDAVKARHVQAGAQYQKAALNGYREVANALVTIRKLAETRLVLEGGVSALRNAGDLARSRYDAGLANYLEILNADQELFDQELQLAQVRGAEKRAYVELYRSLGGGWQPKPEPQPSPSPSPSPGE
jgi:multidrug efflux system outer membrane protein